MNKKLFALLALMLVIAMCVFVACDKDDNPIGGNEHVHAYTQWAHDDTQHWKACSCGEIDNATKANHAFVDGAACTVCGRYSLKAEVTSAFNRLSAYSVVVENATIPSSDQNVKISLADAHVGLDEDGKLFAWATVSATSDVFVSIKADGTTATVNLGQGINVVISNDVVYLSLISDTAYSWNGFAVSTTEGYLTVGLEEFMDQMFASAFGMDMTYAELKATVSGFLAQLDTYSETVVELFELIGSLGTDAEPLTDEDGNAVTSFIVVTANTDGSKTYTVDFKALHAINNVLSTYTVGDYLTAIFGEDYATVISATLTDAFKVSVGDVVALVQQQTGMTLDELIALANQLVATAMGDDSVTIDALLAQAGILQDGVTLKALLSDNVVKAYTLEDLLAILQNGAEEKINSAQLIAGVLGVLEEYSNYTIYDIIGSSMMMSDGDGEMTIGKQIGLVIGQIIDLIDEFVRISAEEDKDGVLQSVTLDVGFDKDFALGEDSVLAGTSFISVLQKVNGTLTVKRGVEKAGLDDIIKNAQTQLDTITGAIAKDLLKDEAALKAFIESEFLYDDEHEEILSLKKNADGDWILTVKGYYDRGYINYGDVWESIKEAMEWTDENIQGCEYGYIYTFSLNLNKDFSILTLKDTACNGKRRGEISAFYQKQIEGIYVAGTDINAYKWLTEPISAEQLNEVLEILEDGSIYAYDWLTSGYLTASTGGNRYIDIVYDSVNKTVAIDTEYGDLHDWEFVTEFDEDDLPCGYYTELTQKCSHCNATRKVYYKGDCKEYEWTEPELQTDDCDDGRISYKRCTECGKSVGERLEYGHTRGDEIAEGDCTTEKGVTYHCTVCGKDEVYNNYKQHYWQISEKFQTYDGAIAKWIYCGRCTSGKHWELYLDSDNGWTVSGIDGGTLYTMPDGVSIAKINGVYYVGYNEATGAYEYRLDNETGAVVPYADDQVAA